MKKIFVTILYLIWIASFMIICSECENAFVFITTHLTACVTLVCSSLLIQKYD